MQGAYVFDMHVVRTVCAGCRWSRGWFCWELGLIGRVVLGGGFGLGYGCGYEDRWELPVLPEGARMTIEVIEARVRSGEIGEGVVL